MEKRRKKTHTPTPKLKRTHQTNRETGKKKSHSRALNVIHQAKHTISSKRIVNNRLKDTLFRQSVNAFFFFRLFFFAFYENEAEKKQQQQQHHRCILSRI